mmetsp:Transcript_17196/g.47981  ORF Transcript_17196/g.47981 Transcript_17196/m.47981 type:complete len:323 (+) Transcript_17196:895-1863(+)
MDGHRHGGGSGVWREQHCCGRHQAPRHQLAVGEKRRLHAALRHCKGACEGDGCRAWGRHRKGAGQAAGVLVKHEHRVSAPHVPVRHALEPVSGELLGATGGFAVLRAGGPCAVADQIPQNCGGLQSPVCGVVEALRSLVHSDRLLDVQREQHAEGLPARVTLLCLEDVYRGKLASQLLHHRLRLHDGDVVGGLDPCARTEHAEEAACGVGLHLLGDLVRLWGGGHGASTVACISHAGPSHGGHRRPLLLLPALRTLRLPIRHHHHVGEARGAAPLALVGVHVVEGRRRRHGRARLLHEYVPLLKGGGGCDCIHRGRHLHGGY